MPTASQNAAANAPIHDTEDRRYDGSSLRFRSKGLFEKHYLEKIADLDAGIEEEIQSAINRVEEQMQMLNDPTDMFEHAYAEMPPYLKAQKEAFAMELAEKGKEGADG